MPVDPYAKRFLDRLCASSPRSTRALSVAERRAGLESLLSLAGPRAAAHIEDRAVAGATGTIRARLYTPGEGGGPRPGLVYFHGGGLVAGSLGAYDAICCGVAQSSGCRVLSVDYRLAPEHRFPAAIADGCAALRWIAEHCAELDIDPERLAIGGDSAGATLAAVICQEVGRSTRLALQLLLCPIMDFGADTPSRRAFRTGYLLDEATLEHDLEHYLPPDINPGDPRVSPLRAADLQGLPPACIHTAECDPVRDEGEAYARRLEQSGVRTMYRCHPGMIHLFYGLGAVIPYAAAGYKLIGADIRAMLADVPPERR